MVKINNTLVIGQILDLANQVISARNDRKMLEEKGKIFIKALKEHEQTVRISIENHTKQTIEFINAIKVIAQSVEDAPQKMEALRLLAQFGSQSIKELSKTADSAFRSLPALNGKPSLKDTSD